MRKSSFARHLTSEALVRTMSPVQCDDVVAPESEEVESSFTGVLNEGDQEIDGKRLEAIYEADEVQRSECQPLPYVWLNVTISVISHILLVYGVIGILTGYLTLLEFSQGFIYGQLMASGVICGAHRLWAHRAYKAKLPLRLFFIFLQTSCGQNSVYEWVRDHRVHHKYTETDADPHNIKRGFFFAHMGWLLCKKHPDVKTKGKLVDMSDLEADPWIMWQHKYYHLVVLPCTIFIPSMIFYCFIWDRPYSTCLFYAGFVRYMLSLHLTWLVNSYAHTFGTRPYDARIRAIDSPGLSFFALGEGWHNYHHVFPWDYKASEYHAYSTSMGSAIIDFFALFGLAYDLKTVDKEMIRKRAIRTGDGSHPLWGWGDKDITSDHVKVTIRKYAKSKQDEKSR